MRCSRKDHLNQRTYICSEFGKPHSWDGWRQEEDQKVDPAGVTCLNAEGEGRAPQ